MRAGQGRATLVASALCSAIALVAGFSAAACTKSALPPQAPAPLPRAAYAHYLAGRAAAFDEKPRTAVEHLRAAALAAPDEPLLAVALINALRELEDFAAARAESTRALARWPRTPDVWRATGELYAAEKAYTEAAAAFRRAIELDGQDEAAHIGLVGALQEQGSLEAPATRAAITDVVRHLLVALPDSVAGHYLLAQLALLEPPKPAGAARAAGAAGAEPRAFAIAQLRTVLRLSPGHLDARALLAEELRLAGDLPAAIAEARSAFDRSGEDLDFAEPLLDLLCEAGDRRAALDLLGLYDDAERAPSDLVRPARWSLELGELPLAHRLLDRAVAGAALLDDNDALAALSPLRLLAAVAQLWWPIRLPISDDATRSRCIARS